jgi:hypothetical protein
MARVVAARRTLSIRATRARGKPRGMPAEPLTDLARTIQLAVAPVFLLTALGTVLSVLSARLGRIVDRVRQLAAREQLPQLQAELAALARRRELINYAITSAVIAALQVCLLISAAFVGFMLHRNFSLFIAGLFIGAMGAFILSLLLFLREILMAVGSNRLQRQ